MSASNDEELDTTESPPISFVKWLSLSLVLTAMLAFAAAHVSGQAGIICRFAAMFGPLVGTLIGWLSGQGGTAKSYRRTIIAATIAAAGFIGLTLESRRLYVVTFKEKIANGVGFMPVPKEVIDNMVAARSQFTWYLRYRVSANRLFGNKALSVPWPAVIWAVEIILAALLAAGAFHIFTRPPTQNPGSSP
jgi:hypothetical protein